MELKTLYEEYGKLMVQMEMLQGRIAQVKQAIGQELGKGRQTASPPDKTKKEDKKK